MLQMFSLLAGHDTSKASVQVFIDNYVLRNRQAPAHYVV